MCLYSKLEVSPFQEHGDNLPSLPFVFIFFLSVGKELLYFCFIPTTSGKENKKWDFSKMNKYFPTEKSQRDCKFL